LLDSPKLILPSSVSEERKLALEPKIITLADIIGEHELSPVIEQRGRELADILESHKEQVAGESGLVAIPKLRLQRLYGYLDKLFGRDSEEGSIHCKLMYGIVAYLAAELGIKGAGKLHRAGYAAVLHDIGKAALPATVMEAVEHGDDFTPQLRELMKVHVLTGYIIAEMATRNVPGLRGIASLILCHHEEFEGLGYVGLTGKGDKVPLGNEDEIPLVSMIISVVDSYLAVVRKRDYDPRSPPEATLQELLRGAYLPFNEDVLREFNKDKLEELKARYKEKYREGWETAYKGVLVTKLEGNTREGRRIPGGFRWNYQELILRGSVEELERAYTQVRLSRERKYYPIVVNTFIKLVREHPEILRKVVEQAQ